MKNTVDLPDNLQRNLISTLNFYKNIFNYQNILIIYREKEKFDILLQTGRQKLKPFFYAKPNSQILKKTILKNNHLKNSELIKLCNHFSIQALFPFYKKYYVAINNPEKNFSTEETKIGEFFAQYLENLIKSENLFADFENNSKRMQQMIMEISTLHEITRALDSGRSLDTLLHYIMEKCKRIMNAEATSLMLVTEKGDELEFKITLGPKSEEVKPFKLPMGKGISGWVAETGKPVLIPDAYADKRFDPSFDKRSGFKTRSVLCVPMTYKNKILGVMTVLNRLDQFSFTENDQMLLTIFASQAALAIENARLLLDAIEKERLDKELQVAAEVQNLLIPQELPKIKGLDISATYLPCLEISGDFYNIIPLSEYKFIFVVADVSGKGIPAALVVSNMQATLRAYLEYSTDLLAIVSKLNACIIEQTTSDRYITFFIGLYDADKLEFEYINAGHNPPLHYDSKNKITPLKMGGISIGFFPFNYQSETISLSSGNILLLYTDGLVEAMDSNEEEFGEHRLIETIEENAGRTSGKIQEKIIERVKIHIGDNKLEDDFTLVVVKVQSNRPSNN
ncbi:SpoIIE family protein phosphatase [Calditrichota bacterium]